MLQLVEEEEILQLPKYNLIDLILQFDNMLNLMVLEEQVQQLPMNK